MLRHDVERHAGHDGWRAGGQRNGVQLADERNMPHRVLEFIVAEVEVVDAKRLLKHGRVGRLRNGEQHGIHMAHVVSAYDARPIGQPLRVTIVRRSQQQGGRIDGSARRHDDIAREDLLCAVLLDRDTCDFAARRACEQPGDACVGDECHVWMRERRIDADDLGVTFRVN